MIDSEIEPLEKHEQIQIGANQKVRRTTENVFIVTEGLDSCYLERPVIRSLAEAAGLEVIEE